MEISLKWLTAAFLTLIVLLSAPQLGSAQIRTSQDGQRGLGQGTSNNWAGYVKTGGIFTSMTSAWTVPSVSYVRYPGSSDAQITAAWIGIGGNDDQTLIQLGTTQGAQSSGAPLYYGWYLLVDGLNNAAVRLPQPINAGDRIEATLTCVSNCTPNSLQAWRMSLRNVTRGWTWDNGGQTFKYKSTLASAEWIMEAVTRQAGGGVSKLPKFGSTSFDNAKVNGTNPHFDLLRDALSMTSDDHRPVAVPSLAQSGNSFTVSQVGLPPSSPYPNNPVQNFCKGSNELGELTQTVRSLEGSIPTGRKSLYGFFLTSYARLNTFLVGSKPYKYRVMFISDHDGMRFSVERDGAPLSLDPGYYCLEVSSDTGPDDVRFRINLSSTPAGGFVPPATKSGAFPIAQLELGNLTHNGYYGPTRYIRYQQSNNPNIPEELIPYRFYVMRDWLSSSKDQQWFRVKVQNPMHFRIDFWAPYLAAYASLETDDGTIVAATDARATPLDPFLVSQTFEGDLPAGVFFLHIGFAHIGMPGTSFSISLEAN